MKSIALAALTLFTLPAFARIEAFPSSLRFQDTTVGRRSLPQQITVTNRGTDDIQSIQVLGSCGLDFDVQTVTCFGPLRANQSCSMNVAFSPHAEGPAFCSITISGDGSSEFISASGRGVKSPAEPASAEAEDSPAEQRDRPQ